MKEKLESELKSELAKGYANEERQEREAVEKKAEFLQKIKEVREQAITVIQNGDGETNRLIEEICSKQYDLCEKFAKIFN